MNIRKILMVFFIIGIGLIPQVQALHLGSGPIERGDLAHVVVQGLGLVGMTNSKDGANFPDIDSDNSFKVEIRNLKDLGIVHGDKGLYYPERIATKGELAKILVLSLEKKGVELGLPEIYIEEFEKSGFSEYLYKISFVQGTYENPIFGEESRGKFDPNEAVTWEETLNAINHLNELYFN